ncbi:YheC/YheD family protein [Paenibacillus sp. GCM10012307]|uniref:YheC/YheD family protein n=1 Tax=Paenibacillus roseus TaxID=2798579 RepID=A0A934IYR7_9BACL|nr:YheC/YheD family protein [Paenibacillus roseus]MBJ6361697.1 YheC/YheD family protein [Paenibacillus roseus]
MTIQRITSKWDKTKVLLRNTAFHRLIPETAKLSKASLGEMLGRYGMVYVKPNRGTFGNGVIRVEKVKRGFKYQTGTKIRVFANLDSLYSHVKRTTGRRLFLVQKGIQLLKHANRRFDFRVMVQLSPKGKWETTGIIGRLAYPKKIVTNYHSGGTPLPFEKLMSTHMNGSQQQNYMSMLRKMGIQVAQHMQSTYPRIKEIGIDVAVDSKLNPWILEVNTKPDPYIFRKLKDRSVFQKVYRYAVAYGRLKGKRT